MRAVSVHTDAIVVTSLLFQTNAVCLRAGEEAMLIDSPIFPDELELLPTVLGQAGFEPAALLATHADWDHLLGKAAFPELSVGVADSTMARVRAEPGAAQRALRDADAEYYISRPRPLALGSMQSLPVPGRLGLGEEELELHDAGGHTVDGMAVFAPWIGVLAVGDYLSGVEIPMISPGGSLAEYRSTVSRLASVAERADVVVPGHGAPLDRDAALRVAEEDLAYLDALERRERAIPDRRDTVEQRRIHEANVAAVSA